MRPCLRKRRRRSFDVASLIRRLASVPPDRLERLAEIHRLAFASTSWGWSGGEIGALADAGAIFADDDDRAFALFSLVLDEAELLTVAVDPTRHRQGLARATLGAAEAALATGGVKTIHLEVAADNVAAISLYQTLDYRITGRRKAYYRRADGDRVDAVTMAKSF